MLDLKTRKNDLLTIYLKAGLFLGPAFFFFFAFFEAWKSILAPFAFTLITVICWFARKKYKGQMKVLFTLNLFIAPIYCCLFSGGIFSPFVIWFLPVGLMAVQLLGSKHSLTFSVASLFGLAFIISLNNHAVEMNEFPTANMKMLLALMSISTAVFFNNYVDYFSRKFLEEELELSDNQRMGVDKHSLITITDNQGRILYANDYFCEISEYSNYELIGKGHTLVDSDKHSREFYGNMHNKLKAGKLWKGDICNRSRSGEDFWVNCTVVPIKNSNGRIYQYVSIMNDITQKKGAETLLKNAMDEINNLASTKDNFLSSMSHEIRTPLNGIIGIAEALSHTSQNQENKEYIEMITYSGKNLLTIVNEILDFSKIQARKLDVNLRDFELGILLDSVKANFKLITESKGVDFYMEIDEKVPTFLYSDDTRIFQILNNIIGNAVKFTVQGCIKFNINIVKKDNGRKYIEFIIADTGIGMGQEIIDKMFIPFERADATTNRNFSGTGLGLCIVKSITDILYGEITVESSLGNGTTFNVLVPYEDASISNLDNRRLPTNQNEELSLVGGVSILVVEDNLINQRVIKALLGKLDLVAEYANDGVEAIEALGYKKFDIIFMDMKMPNMGGVEATKIIRKENLGDNPYIIALTANAYDDDRIECLEAGMDAFLSKPVNVDAIKGQLIKLQMKEKAA